MKKLTDKEKVWKLYKKQSANPLTKEKFDKEK